MQLHGIVEQVKEARVHIVFFLDGGDIQKASIPKRIFSEGIAVGDEIGCEIDALGRVFAWKAAANEPPSGLNLTKKQIENLAQELDV